MSPLAYVLCVLSVVHFVTTVSAGLNCENETNDLCCNFDQGLCKWNQTTEDETDWTRTNSGPIVDHTKGDSTGYYLYLPSQCITSGSKAGLISPVVSNPDGKKCLRFYYYMYSSECNTVQCNVGTLRVRILYTRYGAKKQLWKQEISPGQQWNISEVQINTYTPYQIILEGTTGAYGAIAIDDVQLIDGLCPNVCQDASEGCEAWSKSFCYQKFLKENCRKFCGLC